MRRGRAKPSIFHTMEKLDAEPALERLDAVTDGARREVQFVGRLPKAVVTGSGLEDPK